MRPVLILKTGSTFSDAAVRLGDFEDWIIQGLEVSPTSIMVICPYWPERLPAPNRFSAVIVTGSHAMLTRDLPWMRRTAIWLARLPQSFVPVLGICFGHHLLVRALGGEVRKHPQGVEIGTVRIRTTSAARRDPLFHQLGPELSVHAAHAQSATRLPPGAEILAENEWEPHHAFRYGDRIWGLQFHPEFSRQVVREYRNRNEGGAQNGAEQWPGDPMAADLNGRIILRRFADLISKE